MSLFSINNILLNESTTNDMNVDNLGYNDTEIDNYSFTQEGYNMILALNADFIAADKVFFENVMGSHGEDMIINESFSDFFQKIKDIIKKFIDWLKKVFKDFVIKLNGLVSSDKYIKKHHKELNKFGSEHEFEYKGYKFTNVEAANIPKANALEAFEAGKAGAGYLTTDVYSDWSDYEAASSDEDKKNQTSAINTALDAKQKQLDESLTDFYDDFRGRVIGESEKIDSTDYAEELFKKFRDGEDTPSDITVDSNIVSACYRRFDNYKDTIKEIEKNQKAMIKDYEALEKYLDKMITVDKANKKLAFTATSNDYITRNIDVLAGNDDGKKLSGKTIHSTTTTDKMSNYLKTQSSKVSQMCQIHTQAFSAKLEAAKDQFKQDKKILYKALAMVNKKQTSD